ncbi:MAG TPA: hypothetical protein VFA50_00090 [Stellaceae bacterium]|nr:hypothetical protein [Stellaceae bacterium]
MDRHDRSSEDVLAAGPSPSLAAFRELECVYDGPIPEPVRRAAEFGSARALLFQRATSEAAFFGTMVRAQLRTIRRRRADRTFCSGLIDDLALYRRQFRAWRRLRATLAEGRSPAA